MKYLFLARFAIEGRTLEAAYSAWGALTFDPNKDDIEQFILKVEELAKKLGYNEDAQVKAVKSVLPRDVYGICMTYKKLKDLKASLIELFSNPKMREAVPGTASAAGDSGVFSIGQHMENNVVSPTAADVSKIHQDMNALQVRFNNITSADARSLILHLVGKFLVFLILCKRSLFLWLCINIYLATLGNVVTVCPRIIQGLTFLSA